MNGTLILAKAQVRRLREEGVGVRQISMLTGISESTVKRIIARAVTPVEKSPPKPDRAEIRDKRLLLRREEILAHVKKLKAATRAESQKPKRRQQAIKLIRR
jgi:transposase